MDATLESAEIIKCRNSIITYIINAAATKIAFKEKDMMVALDRKGKLFHVAFEKARESLQSVYGILVEAVPNSKIGKCYICYNKEKNKTLLLFDQEQKRHLTLLFIILSYIFMRSTPSSNETSEENLESFLKGLGIHFNEDHEFFGKNIKKLVTETFVKQLYLQRIRYNSHLENDTKFKYSWGHRADVEFDKKLLLEATAKILNKPPTSFTAKYQEVNGKEESIAE